MAKAFYIVAHPDSLVEFPTLDEAVSHLKTSQRLHDRTMAVYQMVEIRRFVVDAPPPKRAV